MSDKIYTDVEPLQNVQHGLYELRDRIRPIEQRFKRILDEYDREIAESLGSMDEKHDYQDLDYEERRRKLEQKRADLQEKKAAFVAYNHAKEEFLHALESFYSVEGYATDSGLSSLGNAIVALENYLNAGRTKASHPTRSGKPLNNKPWTQTSGLTDGDNVSSGESEGPVLHRSQGDLRLNGNVKTCPECRGMRKIWCPVCKGNSKGSNNTCTYCNNEGLVTCNICGGTGKLDGNDDYRA